MTAPSLLQDDLCVRVIALHLDGLDAEFELLDADERARAVRFATPVLQRRFIAAHVALRRLLAWAAGVPADALRIAADPRGKPELPECPGLHFSLSHCGGQALVALDSAPVGIDIEALIQRDTDVLAMQILAPAEFECWRRLPQDHRIEALTEAWTRKEALLKACGLGLRQSPASFEAPTGEVELAPAGRFRLRTLPAPPGHCAALAQTPSAREVRHFRLLPGWQLQALQLSAHHAA